MKNRNTYQVRTYSQYASRKGYDILGNSKTLKRAKKLGETYHKRMEDAACEGMDWIKIYRSPSNKTWEFSDGIWSQFNDL